MDNSQYPTLLADQHDVDPIPFSDVLGSSPHANAKAKTGETNADGKVQITKAASTVDKS